MYMRRRCTRGSFAAVNWQMMNVTVGFIHCRLCTAPDRRISVGACPRGNQSNSWYVCKAGVDHCEDILPGKQTAYIAHKRVFSSPARNRSRGSPPRSCTLVGFVIAYTPDSINEICIFVEAQLSQIVENSTELVFLSLHGLGPHSWHCTLCSLLQ